MAEMRRLGVTRVRSADVEIELGPAPAVLPATPEPPSDADRARMRREHTDRLLFAHTRSPRT